MLERNDTNGDEREGISMSNDFTFGIHDRHDRYGRERGAQGSVPSTALSVDGSICEGFGPKILTRVIGLRNGWNAPVDATHRPVKTAENFMVVAWYYE